MKKFTKIAVVLAAILTIIGLICLAVSFGLGFTQRDFANMVDSGKFNFSFDRIGHLDKEKDIATELQQEFRNLDIELGAGVLELSYGDVEEVQVQQDKVSGFGCYVEDMTLHIEGGRSVGVHNTDETIKIVIPKDKEFEEVDLEVGAGKARLQGLIVSTMDIEVGAGEAEITDLDVKHLNAETGAGQLSVEVVGEESDYGYDMECGIGELKVGDNSYGGFGSSQHISNPGANRHMRLECGIGKIEVVFAE